MNGSNNICLGRLEVYICAAAGKISGWRLGWEVSDFCRNKDGFLETDTFLFWECMWDVHVTELKSPMGRQSHFGLTGANTMFCVLPE